MPNIFKRATNPRVEDYQFPHTEELLAPLPEESNTLDSEDLLPVPHTPVDYARLQADAILQDARKQADEMLERARQAAEKDLEELRRDEQAKAYRNGFAQGVADGMAHAKAQQEQQALEQAAQIRQFLQGACRERDAFMARTANELRDLAISIAEKIVRISLKSSREVVSRMILAATEKQKKREWVHIYIAGCDVKDASQAPPELATALSKVADHVKIIPMADDESGTCIIETPDEIIDASVSTQLGNIRSLLSNNAQHEAQ